MNGSHNRLFWRNSLLLIAGICLVGAVAGGDHGWAAASPGTAAAVVLLVVAGGYLAALGIREFAGILFKLDDKPWYAQRGGICFLMIMLAVLNALCQAAVGALPRGEAVARAFRPLSLLFIVTATTLVWVAFLDWPGTVRHKPEPFDAPDGPEGPQPLTPVPPAGKQSSQVCRPTPTSPTNRLEKGGEDARTSHDTNRRDRLTH